MEQLLAQDLVFVLGMDWCTQRRPGMNWQIGWCRCSIATRYQAMGAKLTRSRAIRRRRSDDRGRDDDSGRPSLRTGQANFWHPALQLVVTSKKIGKPQHAPVLRRTSQPWR